ncbi:MAG: DUF488 family protein [Acidobacteriia bacterium]|nr:DUF488 family protein [Terriglobia bacterium]
MPIKLKRAYEKPSAGDGFRVLVDGLWPRGMKKGELQAGQWMREIAPSASLRKWYGHRPERWEDFRRKYRAELAKAPRKSLLDELVARARRETVTLVFAARDGDHSNAAVVAEMVHERLYRRSIASGA